MHEAVHTLRCGSSVREKRIEIIQVREDRIEGVHHGADLMHAACLKTQVLDRNKDKSHVVRFT